MGALNRPSQVIVVYEGERDQQFVRKYLYRAGYGRHNIVFAAAADGKGSGEQRVRAEYKKNVEACRSRNKRVNTALIVMIDADTGSVADRQKQLREELGQNQARESNEIIVHLIPRRNIETWILCLARTEFNEELNYRLRHDVDRKLKMAAEAFYDGSRPNVQPPEHWVPSLLDAIPEIQRLP
jgi:hypothetical protein